MGVGHFAKAYNGSTDGNPALNMSFKRVTELMGMKKLHFSCICKVGEGYFAKAYNVLHLVQLTGLLL